LLNYLVETFSFFQFPDFKESANLIRKIRLGRISRRYNVKGQRGTEEKGKIDIKRRTKRKYEVQGTGGEQERERGREGAGRCGEVDANSRPGEIKMSRVYPGTNTPCQRIRAAAGTGEPEEPAALVPATAQAASSSSERRETLRGALSRSRIPARRPDARR